VHDEPVMHSPRSKPEPIFVEEEEAAELTRLDVPTIQHLIQTGQLPVKLVGAKRLIPYKSLLVFAGVARWRYQEIMEF
jgi:excisionase family DNA binding protein